ncbi:hypothetical protein DSL72_005962 [Monilinia vaccinii-corymbosi]|uniref:Uncharacterized protein n=1 Tax=Monilinia vaccinii-corymbosi TaxID=61207 RepID=A0A8A3PH32_9HELO|nr:hypothetical protein DSL72_005962 [Monilinia vaccinii-corymbosi]
MSSSAPGAPVALGDGKKKGFSRVLGRMKTVLRRSDGSKRLSFTTATAPNTTPTTTAGPSATQAIPVSKPIPMPGPKAPKETPTPAPAAAAAPVPIPSATEPKEITTTPSPPQPQQTPLKAPPPPPPPPPPNAKPTTKAKPQAQPIKVSRAEINAERARKLAERFQLQIEPHEWQTLAGEREAWRVEKPIRMRIHRTCHKCATTFGPNKICVACAHPRCTKCPRFPTKAKGKEKEKGKGKTAVATSGPIPVAGEWKLKGKEKEKEKQKQREKLVMTLPSGRVGGQPLVRKKPMQRVRRTCHECSTLFVVGCKICATCSHVRCADCPRDPPKKSKYPDGYPGDQPSSLIIKFACHQCDKTFPPHRDAHRDDGSDPPPSPSTSTREQVCRRCKHVRCERCLVALPRRVVPEPDAEVLRRVEERLRGLKIRSWGSLGGAGGAGGAGVGG